MHSLLAGYQFGLVFSEDCAPPPGSNMVNGQLIHFSKLTFGVEQGIIDHLTKTFSCSDACQGESLTTVRLFNFALAAQTLGFSGVAEKAYTLLLKKDRNYVNAWWNLGSLYYNQALELSGDTMDDPGVPLRNRVLRKLGEAVAVYESAEQIHRAEFPGKEIMPGLLGNMNAAESMLGTFRAYEDDDEVVVWDEEAAVSEQYETWDSF